MAYISLWSESSVICLVCVDPCPPGGTLGTSPLPGGTLCTSPPGGTLGTSPGGATKYQYMVSCCVDVETAKPETETSILVAKEIGGFFGNNFSGFKKKTLYWFL